MAGSPHNSREDLNLLLDWQDQTYYRRLRNSLAGAVVWHVVLLLVLVSIPPSKASKRGYPRLIAEMKVPLYIPEELTQKDPNRGKIGEEFELRDLLPRPRSEPVTAPPSNSTTRPAAPRQMPLPAPAPPRPAEPKPIAAEPPKLETGGRQELAQLPPPPEPLPQGRPAPPPKIEPEEKPKLAFESVASYSKPASSGIGVGLPAPDTSVAGAVKELSTQRSGGMVVGDLGEGIGGLGSGLNLPPAPGNLASQLELKSDPMGVDFRPYLTQILSTVRRNWFAVIPESASMGRPGSVVIQFAINRDGKVPKLVIANSSGFTPYDRAAVAGISASNPFPPLPREFRGDQIRLQFNFAYNRKKNR